MPPRFAFFCNLERGIPPHYVRFLESRFRTALKLDESGTPLRLEFRLARGSRINSDRPMRGRRHLPARAKSDVANPEAEND
jgi:hypothetical protein